MTIAFVFSKRTSCILTMIRSAKDAKTKKTEKTKKCFGNEQEDEYDSDVDNTRTSTTPVFTTTTGSTPATKTNS